MIPNHLKYATTHEWIQKEGDILTIGITHHAQKELGDIIFIELPQIGDKTSMGSELSTIEAVKTVATIYSPCEGEIIEVNTQLEEEAETINKSPYEKGWIAKIKITHFDESSLLSDSNYAKHIGE